MAQLYLACFQVPSVHGSAVQSRSSDDSALETRHARSRATHLVVVVLAEVGVVVVVVTRLLKRRETTQVSDRGETTQVG